MRSDYRHYACLKLFSQCSPLHGAFAIFLMSECLARFIRTWIQISAHCYIKEKCSIMHCTDGKLVNRCKKIADFELFTDQHTWVQRNRMLFSKHSSISAFLKKLFKN